MCEASHFKIITTHIGQKRRPQKSWNIKLQVLKKNTESLKNLAY